MTSTRSDRTSFARCSPSGRRLAPTCLVLALTGCPAGMHTDDVVDVRSDADAAIPFDAMDASSRDDAPSDAFDASMATDQPPPDDVAIDAPVDRVDPRDVRDVSTAGEAARSADSFVESVGVVTHLGYPSTPYQTQFAAWVRPRMHELGVRHIRTDQVAIGSTGATNMQTLANDPVAIHAMIVVNPRQIAPADVPALVHGLQPAVEAVEGPNEPNLAYENFSYEGMGFPAGVRLYAHDLATAMRAAADPVVRATPLVASALGQPNASNHAQLGDLSAWVDLGSLHNYFGASNPAYRIDARIALARGAGGADHPIYVTESGWHNAVPPLPRIMASQDGVSEEAGSRYVPRLFLLNFNQPQIARTYEYELIDDSQDAGGITDQENHFGILRYDGSRKPAFESLRNLITLLTDRGPAFAPRRLDYTLTGTLTDIEHTLVAHRDGRVDLIVWQEVPSYDPSATPRDLVVPPRALSLTLRDHFAHATLYQPHDGMTPIAPVIDAPTLIPLSVHDHPLVIELTP